MTGIGEGVPAPAQGDRGTGGEVAAIARIAALLADPPDGETWIGDDAAVVTPSVGPLLLTTDAVVGGVHCDLGLVTLEDLGWKAVTVNVSDIAAMGGSPMRAVAAVVGPPELDMGLLYRGIAAAAVHYRCPIVGGDLANAPVPVVTVSVLGECGDAPPLLRSGAKPGDILYVTGPLGASAAGLARLRSSPSVRSGAVAERLIRAHRRPLARVREGEAARSGGASAMIDVSDGLAIDLDRLASASGVGVVVDEVPVAEGAYLADALGGGEDYELLFSATDSTGVESAFEAAGLRAPLPIGRCSRDPGERRLGRGELPRAGWEHHFGRKGER